MVLNSDSMDDAKVKGTRKYERVIWEKGFFCLFFVILFFVFALLNFEDPEQASSAHTNLVTKVLSYSSTSPAPRNGWEQEGGGGHIVFAGAYHPKPPSLTLTL